MEDPKQATLVSTVELPPAEAGAPVVPLRLTLQPGGLSVELTKPETVVGRQSDVDVRLPLPDVSRRHCRFVYANGCWQVFDLNSLNGIYVNGTRVPQSVLNNQDTIRIGGFTFQVDLNPAPNTVQFQGGTQERILKSIVNALTPSEAPKRQAS